MLQKWKEILTNWINCYFNESEKRERVTFESLLNIISHLRENFNLDESKSSILEADTVEEFIQEKYPEFLVNSGSFQDLQASEDETCYAASLLLLFVCVNSKDVDLKNAMCSNLSSQDQETILKFSKRLMECSPITRKDVQAAITEACSQDSASSSSRAMVSETPPALRSLHGEVRRLQAALDAERFDRNYLQEELARTNLRVEKLAKDKEQYKLEIVNLKAKISMCCGQESDSRTGDAGSEGTAKLMRQLEEMEERLVQTQGQLDEAQYERDTYKVKINELKREREKLVIQSQQDTTLISQLSDELETERRNTQSLRELVAELQQHHRLNRMDSSQLECDDPDASIHSLQHNSSVCSEACANVIEVQLGEERAKIVVLKQHIQTLQEQLNELTQKSESEIQSLESIVSERENDIFSLKHRINEEIEEKNNLTIQYSDDVSKLNNEINELEQKLKDNNNQCRLIVEMKMQEIQTLQEEKLSLLQSLADETTKFQNDIKKLKSDLDVERSSRAQMKEDYENHIMKLNEKVLNRNNELVELQNNVFEKSEQIETIHMELRKEKHAKDELIEKHHREIEEINGKLMQSEDTVQRKSEEIESLVERLNYNFEIIKEYGKELDNLKYSLSEQNENCNMLEANKGRLLEEIAIRDNKIEELHKDIENWRNNFSEERDKLTHNLDSAIATANTLQTQLQDELQFKIGLQNECINLKHTKNLLSNEVERQKTEIDRLKNTILDKDRTIEGIDLVLEEEKRIVEQFKLDCQYLNKKLQETSEEIIVKNKDIKEIEDRLISERNSFEEVIREKDLTIQTVNNKLSTEMQTCAALESQLNNERENISLELDEKVKQIAELQAKTSELNSIVEQNRKCFQIIESKLEDEMLKCTHLEKTFNNRTAKLVHKLTITENVIKELKSKYKKADEDKQLKIRQLKEEIEQLNKIIETERSYVTTKTEMCKVLEATKDNLLKDIAIKETKIKELCEDINSTNKEKDKLTHDLNSAINTVNALQVQLQDEFQSKVDLRNEMTTLQQVKTSLINEFDNQKAELSKLWVELDNKEKVIDGLDLFIEENKQNVEKIKSVCQNLNEKVQEMSGEIIMKNNELKQIENKLVNERKSFEQKLIERDVTLQSLNEKLVTENEVKDSLELQIRDERDKTSHELKAKAKQIAELQEDNMKLNGIIEKNRKCLQTIESKLKDETLKYASLEKNFDTQITNLMHKLTITEKVIQELKSKSKKLNDNNELQVSLLKAEIEKANMTAEEEREHTTLAQRERDMLTEKLAQELLYRTSIEKEYQNLMTKHNDVILQLNSEFLSKTKESDAKVEILLKTIDEKCDEIKILEDKLTSQTNKEKEITEQKDGDIVDLKKQICDLRNHNDRLLQELADEVENKNETLQVLQSEKEQLNSKIEEMSKQKDTYAATLETNAKNLQILQHDNQSLINELNDVKIKLEVKVHSLKEKLTDNENLTEKLKKTYESQIENLNVMVTKLTNYLKEKTIELEALRKDKEKLQEVLNDSNQVIKSLEEEVKSQKQSQEKLISDFESERLVLKNMVTVTESVMEDQKLSLNKVIAEHLKANEALEVENITLKQVLDTEGKALQIKIQEKEILFENVLKELTEVKLEKENKTKVFALEKQTLLTQIEGLKQDLCTKVSQVEVLELQNQELAKSMQKCKEDMTALEADNNELKIKLDTQEVEMTDKFDNLTKELQEQIDLKNKLTAELQQQQETNKNIELNIRDISNKLEAQTVAYDNLKREKSEYEDKVVQLQMKLDSKSLELDEEVKKMQDQNLNLMNIVEEKKNVITKLEETIGYEKEQKSRNQTTNNDEKLNLTNKCSILQEYQIKAELQLEEQKKEIKTLQDEINGLKFKIGTCEQNLSDKDKYIKEKEEMINVFINKELVDLKAEKDKYYAELQMKISEVNELKQKMERPNNDVKALRSEEWVKAIPHRELCSVATSDKTGHKISGPLEKDYRDFHHQVDTTTSDLTHSSLDSIKTISDLERIIHDKNRTITTLQSDITYLKSLIADSENKLLDVTKELEVSKENCQQLSAQLKKIVYQKNDEIADLKKQLNKMTVTENRATQIIKVSAKYQAIILKRIAEIKSNTILKELTNFGNNANCDIDLRRSLNAGTITMEDLENFLETTDKHLKRCSEKQVALQKERDRLTEVNRINESEIINLKKFLTELSVSFKTFGTVKDLYAQRFSRVVSMQRTVRREILNLDGHITEKTMCKLERGYAAVMQDLAECVMNMERWVERCIGRTISPEKIKQAFTGDEDRVSLASTTFQNTSLEVQLEELEKSFQKLLEEVVRGQKGEGAVDAQAATVMEVRAEYEDKLNRMKAKMNQLYHEQIAMYKEKQKDEIALLERELAKTREKMADSSKAYEEHIRALTAELWSVGEKFLTKKDEVDWLKKKQRSGSLMSLQHVHSSGLIPPQEDPSRPSDTASLRSLPVNNKPEKKREGRGLHMSDEEGEVFDNRWLKELASTPGRPSMTSSTPSRGTGLRLSELRWRNSLCPPHLKSSYPAETQFANAADEEDIKFSLGGASIAGRNQRKEVGITAYKKPGPPTPSKQAGRVSATDSELRESLRVEAEPAARKVATPSRTLRSLFRSSKNDTAEGTPRSKRLSIFRKK